MAELPVDSVNEVMRLAKDLIVTKDAPEALLIFLRVLPSPNQVDSLVTLQSSLLNDSNRPPEIFKSKTGILGAISEWILAQISNAVDELHKKALELVGRSEPCLKLLYRGKYSTSSNGDDWLTICRVLPPTFRAMPILSSTPDIRGIPDGNKG